MNPLVPYSISLFISPPIEEALKAILGKRFSPIFVATGLGLVEVVGFMIDGNSFASRLPALLFHIFTGITLEFAKPKGNRIYLTIAVMNLVLHYAFNYVIAH